MTDFSTPRRMRAGALMIMFLSYFRKYVGIAILTIVPLLFDSDEQRRTGEILMRIIIVFGMLIAISFIVAFMSYYFKKFHVEGDKLIFTHGFAARQTTSIPLQRIHTLRSKSGLFYRIFNLRGVAFDTLASEGQEVELILNERDWQNLLQCVSEGENFDRTINATLPPPLPSEQCSQNIKNSNLIKGALCQNHLKGFAVLASVICALFDKIDQDTASRVIDYIDVNAAYALHTGWLVFCFFVVIYLIVMALWVGKVALRYGDMNISVSGDKMTVNSGLLSRFTSRLSRDKITLLTVKQNPLEKMAGCQTVTMLQANNATTKDKLCIYGSMLGRDLFAWWSDCGEGKKEEKVLSARSGTGMFMRKFVPHLIVAAIVTFGLMSYYHIVWPAIVIGTAYAVIALLRAIKAWKHSKIDLMESYIKVYCGNIARIHLYIKYCYIESICVRSTPFTRHTGRVSLMIQTNAEDIRVHSIEMSDAFAMRNFILNKTEKGKADAVTV